MPKHFRSKEGKEERTTPWNLGMFMTYLVDSIIGWFLPCPYQVKSGSPLSMDSERFGISFYTKFPWAEPRDSAIQGKERSNLWPGPSCPPLRPCPGAFVDQVSWWRPHEAYLWLSRLWHWLNRFPHSHCHLRSVICEILPPMEPTMSLY